MTEQETANFAAVAILARSPDPGKCLEFGRDLDAPASGNQPDLVFEGIGKAALPVHEGATKMKEIDNKRFLTQAKENRKAPRSKITGVPNSDGADDLADIFISDEVLKQLRSHTDNKDKKSSKQRRKIARLQSKTGTLNAANNKHEAEFKDPPRRILKPSLRRRGSLAASKSQVMERTGSMEFRGSGRRDVRNKAANNNWLVNGGKASDAQTRLSSQSLLARSPSSYVANIIRASDSVCKVCCVRNCTPQSCRGVRLMVDPATKEYSFKRADSSDDSGCFSNQSLQSINSPGSQNHDINTDPFPVNEESAIEHNYISVNEKKRSSSSGLCSACGNEPQGNGSGLCKTCIGRIKHDGVRIGALGELRAYAQSIADSVKKILSISPRGDEEVLKQLPKKESREFNSKGTSKRETTSAANIPAGCLQKCKTQISMSVGEDLRPKNVLSKSISFDGRVPAFAEDNNRGSPMYWIAQEKSKLPQPATTFCEAEEDKLLCLENTSDHSVLEGDYFSSDAKEPKQYTANDDDRTSKIYKVNKLNKRNYTKQVSCVVDRVRTEATVRGNSFQNVTQDKKKLYEFQRSRSRISRSVNVDADIYDKPHQKREEEIKALNVFRLKVIHEGSPVDPLYTVQKVKGSDEGKDRRIALMRSATAPNRNHMPRMDNTAEDKTAVMRNAIKAKRSSTRLGTKVISSPIFENEDSNMGNEEPKQIVYEPPPDSWRDDVSVIAVTPFIRRRSTSYDGSKPILSNRSDLHKSISRSAIERDASRSKQRKKTPSKSRTATKNKRENDTGFSWQPSRFPVSWAEDNRPDVALPVSRSTNRGPLCSSDRYHNTDALIKEFSQIDISDRVVGVPSAEDNQKRPESPSRPNYFDDVSYYQRPAEPTLAPIQKELAYTGDRNIFDSDQYYHDAVDAPIDDGTEADKIVSYDANVDRMFKRDEEDDDDDAYHSGSEQYSVNDVSPEKESLWYSSHLNRRALTARDGSHESKSSTSFHVLMNVRSSHSDVALMKYQGAWEHPTSRRQSMYSETDVDTGLIYHFAKRQTTRAHVPTYHDLTSASKDIYTMSGDVSTSASSNSAISTKSEVSDCVYTGGFFKHDPFYDNDSRVSSSSSSADSDQLYFEPNSTTKPREPSELDIYTGAIFSSSQNALSLGTSRETNSTNQPNDALHDGSTNNSTRPVASRMSRRHRYRPRIDVITFKSADSVNGFIFQCMEPNNDILLCNISNNSCTWCNMDEPEDPGNRGAVVRISADPMYTDYAEGMKPVFHTRKVEKPAPVVDLLKYEKQDTPSSSFFFTMPLDDNSSESDWYSGFSKHRKIETASQHPAVKAQSCIQCTYRWQYDDDYYTSNQRPRFDKSNNNELGSAEEIAGITKNSQPCPLDVAENTNNNRLDDIYTGFFESPKASSSPEQQHRSRRTSSDSWYADQPRRSYSGFYRETPPEFAGRTFASDYESTEAAYSSPSVFAQAREAYAGSPSYMSGSGWKEYDRSHSPTNSNYVDDDDDESPRPRPLTPGGYSNGDKYSYFPYNSNFNPTEGGYLYDNESYAFDHRSPSPEQSGEIKKVGGIVCRENVANKEDYAEDVNRDLEQGVWTPYNFRHDEKSRHSDESSSRSEPVSGSHKVAPVSGADKHTSRHYDDSIYNQNRLYDSGGDRKKWRETSSIKKSMTGPRKTPSPHRANNAGDAKKADYSSKSAAWNPPDQIPDKARGKRNPGNTSKSAMSEGSRSGSTTSHVISSVTSLPSRLTNYVKKWL